MLLCNLLISKISMRLIFEAEYQYLRKELVYISLYNIICRNYSNFLCLVEVHEKRITREIIEEKLFNRAEERGNLAVKVQTSRSVASPVENEVISDCELDEAIKSGNIPAGLIVGTDDDETHTLEVLTLKVMRDDYEEFTKNINALQKKDKKLFMVYLESDKELSTVLNEWYLLIQILLIRIWRISKRSRSDRELSRRSKVFEIALD